MLKIEKSIQAAEPGPSGFFKESVRNLVKIVSVQVFYKAAVTKLERNWTSVGENNMGDIFLNRTIYVKNMI